LNKLRQLRNFFQNKNKNAMLDGFTANRKALVHFNSMSEVKDMKKILLREDKAFSK
jgi:hypothetical protein